MKAIFGPAGESVSFKKLKKLEKISLNTYLISMGLKAYEVQCGRRIICSDENVEKLKTRLQNLETSIHSPYYISLSSVDEQKRLNSVKYIIQTAQLAKKIGAKRIIVHSGSCRNLKREEALNLAANTLKLALDELKNEHLDDVIICPETMGKINQLGNLDEVLSLCKLSENLIPCVDFGHLNARTFGSLKTSSDYLEILKKIENKLGFNRLKRFHAHFSKIEYSEPGGEKKHLTFADKHFGPNFEPLAELIVKLNLQPIFICESAGTQIEDAAFMKQVYDSLF